MAATYSVSYQTTGISTITVEATRGTQARGAITGRPVNATKFGSVTVTINGKSRIEFTQEEDVSRVIEALRSAQEVALSRDESRDGKDLPEDPSADVPAAVRPRPHRWPDGLPFLP